MNGDLGKHEEMQGELLARLRKIEGQVRGVHKMIQDQRGCGEIVIQLAAIKSAINRVGMNVLGCHLSDQIEKGLAEGKDVKESISDFMTVFNNFS